MSRIASRNVLAPSSEMSVSSEQSIRMPSGCCRSRRDAVALMVIHWFLWSSPESWTTSSLLEMIMLGRSRIGVFYKIPQVGDNHVLTVEQVQLDPRSIVRVQKGVPPLAGYG